MADAYEAYEIYVRSEHQIEFISLLDARFGSAVELNWRETVEIGDDLSDESYEAYVTSARKDEFTALLNNHFHDSVECNWLETLSV